MVGRSVKHTVRNLESLLKLPGTRATT